LNVLKNYYKSEIAAGLLFADVEELWIS